MRRKLKNTKKNKKIFEQTTNWQIKATNERVFICHTTLSQWAHMSDSYVTVNAFVKILIVCLNILHSISKYWSLCVCVCVYKIHSYLCFIPSPPSATDCIVRHISHITQNGNAHSFIIGVMIWYQNSHDILSLPSFLIVICIMYYRSLFTYWAHH